MPFAGLRETASQSPILWFNGSPERSRLGPIGVCVLTSRCIKPKLDGYGHIVSQTHSHTLCEHLLNGIPWHLENYLSGIIVFECQLRNGNFRGHQF